jgi:hypothetical protein
MSGNQSIFGANKGSTGQFPFSSNSQPPPVSSFSFTAAGTMPSFGSVANNQPTSSLVSNKNIFGVGGQSALGPGSTAISSFGFTGNNIFAKSTQSVTNTDNGEKSKQQIPTQSAIKSEFNNQANAAGFSGFQFIKKPASANADEPTVIRTISSMLA